MHTFTIHTIKNGPTVMFCQTCGKSYILASYGDDGITKAWKEMPFRDGTGKDIDPPGKCLQEEQTHALGFTRAITTQ